jgi:putative oxidoreductase
MASVGVAFWPGFWGFLIAAIEFFGGVCLMLGLFTRVLSLALLASVGVFLASHIRGGGQVLAAGRLLLHAVLFISLLLTGPGRWSLDRALFPGR